MHYSVRTDSFISIDHFHWLDPALGPEGRKEIAPTVRSGAKEDNIQKPGGLALDIAPESGNMSYISNLIHFVWGTKDRQPTIGESWQERLYAYCGGILKNKKSKLLAIGGMPDHIHIYASLPSTVTLAEIANALKSNSSRWIHENVDAQHRFAWQEGYGAFSVSKSMEQTVINYIANQAEHHRRQEFQFEFVKLLEKHGIAYDERYLWV